MQLSWFVFDVKFVQMCACDMMRVLVNRRMAFSEEVVAYLDAAVINSHVILAYLCVWAGERLCGGGRAGTVLPALSPPRPTQSRHRTHLPIYCQRLSGGRAESIHTATPDTTKLSRLWHTAEADRTVLSGLARRCELAISCCRRTRAAR